MHDLGCLFFMRTIVARFVGTPERGNAGHVALKPMASSPREAGGKGRPQRSGGRGGEPLRQWRIVFRWTDAGPEDVEIIDYH